jgi:hypothetical protein
VDPSTAITRISFGFTARSAAQPPKDEIQAVRVHFVDATDELVGVPRTPSLTQQTAMIGHRVQRGQQRSRAVVLDVDPGRRASTSVC